MARNVMKHIVHNWGDNISSIHDGIGPPFVIPTKKNEIFGYMTAKKQKSRSATRLAFRDDFILQIFEKNQL